MPAEELGAPRQADLPAACGIAGILGLSGSGLMPCVPCVLPRPGTLASCLHVSAQASFASAYVCRRTVCSLCLLSAIGRVHDTSIGMIVYYIVYSERNPGLQIARLNACVDGPSRAPS